VHLGGLGEDELGKQGTRRDLRLSHACDCFDRFCACDLPAAGMAIWAIFTASAGTAAMGGGKRTPACPLLPIRFRPGFIARNRSTGDEDTPPNVQGATARKTEWDLVQPASYLRRFCSLAPTPVPEP